jgi:hypothetical protein
MGTRGPFPEVKHGPGMMLTTHPYLVLRLRMSRSCTSSPTSTFMACSGTALLLPKFIIPQLEHFRNYEVENKNTSFINDNIKNKIWKVRLSHTV